MREWIFSFGYTWLVTMGIFTGMSFVKGGMDLVNNNFIPIAIGCAGLAFPGMIVMVLASYSISDKYW
jgi:lipopolysaccharide export LptBFGC system permease protein LptF